MPVGPSPTDLQRKGSLPQCSPRSRSLDAPHGADAAATNHVHRFRWCRRKQSAAGAAPASAAPPHVESLPPRSMTLPSETSRLQEMIYAVALSESIYRLVDDGPVAAVAHANHILSGVPSADVHPINVQCSLSSVPHRYLVAESKEVIMISFVGTKQIQDLLTDINYWQVPLTTADGAPWPATENTDEKRSNNVLVHQGFMARSQHIPIKQLYEHARASGKRLLLCGHSLGGAVATLCTLRLLGMDPEAASHIHCITFACVAIGNPEVMRMVHANGWSHLFQNFILPEDDVVRLALLMQLKGLPSVTREVAAHALAMPGLSGDADDKPAGATPLEHPNHQLLQSSLAFLNRFTIEDLTTLPFASVSLANGARGEPDSQSHLRSTSDHNSPYMHMPAAEPVGGAALAASIRPSGGAVRGWNIPFQARRRWSPTMGGRARSSPHSAALPGQDPPSPTYSQQPRRGRSPARGRKFTSHAVAGVMGSHHVSPQLWTGTGASALQPAHTAPQHPGERAASAPPANTGVDSHRHVELERLASVRSAISESDGMAVASSAAVSGRVERRRRRAAVAALAAARNRAGAKLAGLWSAAQSGAVRFNEHYNVIPSYHPFGLQLYLNPEGVSVGLHSDDADAVSPTSSSGSSAHTAQSPRHAVAERVSGDDLPGTVGDDLEHEVSDLVDRGALLPQPLHAGGGRGKVFHMHRMFNYRHRLLHLLAIMDVLPGPYVAPPVRERGAAAGDAVASDAEAGEYDGEDAEEQLDAGVVRLAEEIIPELQPAHVEVQVHPVRFEVRGGRGGRSAAGRPVLARHCDADVCVQGSGLGFVSKATVQVAGAEVEAGAAAVAASATEQCMRVKLPLAVVQDAAMRPGGRAAVSLRSDFAESNAEAHVRVPQCVVVGSADGTVCGVMHAVAAAVPGDMHVDGAAAESRGEAAPRSWAQALRPMRILQRLPWRSRPRSLDRVGEAAPLEPAPVAVCGGVRYVDACWDFAMRRLSDAATARSLFELAAVLQQQTWREQLAERRRGAAAGAGADAGMARALGALVSNFTTRVSHMRVAVAHQLCMVRRGAWAAILHVSALTSRSMWRMQLSSNQARMRMLASRPVLTPSQAIEASEELPALDPDARDAAALCAEPVEGSRGSPQDSVAAEPCRTNAVRRPRMRVPRALWKRSGLWFSERTAAGLPGARGEADVVVEEESGAEVADFLYTPAAGTRTGVHACVDAVVVAEDVQLWRGQRPPVVTRRRRRAVGRVVEAAVTRGARVVLVLSVPAAVDEGQAFEWLEEVTQMRAAYGLQSVEHRVVVLDAAGESGAACARLHNAVVNSLVGQELAEDNDDAAQMNSKL